MKKDIDFRILSDKAMDFLADSPVFKPYIKNRKYILENCGIQMYETEDLQYFVDFIESFIEE